jgi:hypothetical protein
MSVYERPVWRDPVFRDTKGAVIEYGTRWGQDGPPVETYSVDTHPERFAPLHLVADALIDHLTQIYDVRIDHDPANAADFVRRTDFLRVTRLTPADPAAAPITFGFTAYPSVILHAGLLHDFSYPDCGCDACDETAAGQADLLEWHVLAIAAGNYREAYTPGTQLPVAFSLKMDGELGSQGGQAQAGGYSKDLLIAAGERLRNLPDGWAAWPPRPHGVRTAARR